jgi:hypothetical protein
LATQLENDLDCRNPDEGDECNDLLEDDEVRVCYQKGILVFSNHGVA